MLARLDRLRMFGQSVAQAAGLPAAKLVPADDGPDGLMRGDRLVIVAGVAVFAIHEAGESSRAGSLRDWSQGRLDIPTAFHSLYLEAFSADDLEALDLRIGTVHAFQGNERDLVFASLGIGPDQSGASWRFVEDPHLFAVLMTPERVKHFETSVQFFFCMSLTMVGLLIQAM
ncbi:MAG: hypothetical protein QOK39_2839, partial [Acidimicrobiaceae bacterium]|nr:hypothetical protein [Acidimicrobiaceae bacterium]